MSTYEELKFEEALARYEETEADEQLGDQTLLDEISSSAEEGLIDGLTAKQKEFVDRVVKRFMGTESILTSAAAAVDNASTRAISTMSSIRGVAIDKSRFADMQVASVVPYPTFRLRPQMYATMNDTFKSVSKIMAEPADRNNPVGATLTGVIKKIEEAGFSYKGAGYINTQWIHLNLFDVTDAGRPRTDTMAHLGYTPERLIEVASMFTGNKKPGAWKLWWLAQRAEFYRYRFIWDLIVGRSEDEINRFDGIEIRAYRIGIIKSLSLYQNWRQCVKDLATLNRMLRCMVQCTTSGYERLNFMSIDPNKLLLDASVTDNIDEAIEIDAEETPVVTEEIDAYTEAESAVEQFKVEAQKKLSFNYPTEGVKTVALESLRMDEMRTNKAIAKKMLSLFEKRIKKNEHLLKCLENTSILVGRELRKVSTTLRKQDLDNIVMRNIPKYEDIHRRIAFYNGIRQDFTTSIAELYRPVLHEKDYGKGIENYTNLAMISGFEMFDAETYFSSKPGEVFASNDATYRGSLSDAGYTVAEVLRLAKAVDSMQRVLTSPLPVMNGNIPVTESMIEEAVTLRNAEDKVDRVTACNVRRTRYGMLSRIRSELLLESVLSDTYTTYRLLKALNRAKK